MKVAITGVNGYLGGVVVNGLKDLNIEIIKFTSSNNKSGYNFKLGEDINKKYFDGVECLVHIAYDFNVNTWKDIYEINILGSIKLFNLAVQCGVNSIIFISSMSAYENCKSKYGKAKLLIENYLLSLKINQYIIRPGLIYGDKSGGMIAMLQKIVKIPILPLIGGKTKMFLCNDRDLFNLIYSIINKQQTVLIGGVIIAANENPYPFKKIIKLLGAKLLIPFPWQLVWIFLRFIELLGIKLRPGSDSLVSLINQNPNPNFELTRKSNIIFKDFKK